MKGAYMHANKGKKLNPKADIKWPTNLLNNHHYNNPFSTHHPLLTSAFGTIDSLNLLLQTSADSEIKNITYTNDMLALQKGLAVNLKMVYNREINYKTAFWGYSNTVLF